MARKRSALLVGAGGMGKTWCRNLLSRPQDVAICGWVDVVPGKAAAAAQEIELSESVWVGTDLEHALAALQPDFVVDVTVPESHEGVTRLSLAAGVPVIGEKPMTTTLVSAHHMIRAAEVAGKLYMVSQSRRYDNRLITFRDAVQAAGTLGILNADFYIGAHFGGFRDEMDEVLLMDMAIHTFDTARFIAGCNPVTVYCDSFRVPWSWYQGAESASAIFEFENGMRFSYRGSWAAEGLHTSWESSWRAVCENGTVVWDGDQCIDRGERVGFEGFHYPTTTSRVRVIESVKPGIAGSLEDFLAALDGSTIPMGECHDNVWSLAMVLSAVESSKTGSKVRIKGDIS